MSYTRVMTSAVEWHTSGSVSYPASESGGSMSYSDSGVIPITINVHVDTAPFDESVAGCNTQLGLLTTSVVATNSEHCKAIKSAGENVASHIINGFFTLVGSELSQSMAQLFSTMSSFIALILERTKILLKNRDTMERDYSRILARYQKVFSDLDDECKKRVIELNKDAYNLSVRVLGAQLISSQNNEAAKALTYLNETNILGTKLLLARTKNKVHEVGTAISKNTFQESVYKSKVAAILRDGKSDKGDIFTPVFYTKAVSVDRGGGPSVENYYLPEPLDSYKSAIIGGVGEYIRSGDRWVVQSDSDRIATRSIINALGEDYLTHSADTNKKRIYDVMMSLLDKSKGRTLTISNN